MSLQKTTQSYKKLQKLLNKILAVLNKFSVYCQGKPVKFFRNSKKKRGKPTSRRIEMSAS